MKKSANLSYAFATFFNPVVVMLGWRWFVVPLGVPAIGYWHAMGLDLLVSFVVMRALSEREGRERKEASVAHTSSACVLRPLLVLLVLWLVSFGL